jgi:hypothetical protein
MLTTRLDRVIDGSATLTAADKLALRCAIAAIPVLAELAKKMGTRIDELGPEAIASFLDSSQPEQTL